MSARLALKHLTVNALTLCWPIKTNREVKFG